MSNIKMDPAERGKVMHAARLAIDGTFKSQRAACRALGIPLSLGGRVSDAHTMLVHGVPELIAAVEDGRLAFQTGWQIARSIPPDQQLPVLENALANLQRDGRTRHGIYIGRGNTPAQQFRTQHKQHDRICEAVDKLLDAITERIDALGVCTNRVAPAPEPEQGRKWRITLRRIRKRLSYLEARIDWSKTIADRLKEEEPILEGDRHDTNNSNQGNGDRQDGTNNGPQD